jgi:transposase
VQFHRNAKLGLAGRYELVLAIERGCSIRQAAASFNVSPATAHRWWQRWRQAGAAERVGLACLCDRSSRPAHSPRRLDAVSEQVICDCRRRTGWGPRLITGATGFAHSTVWKVLRRFGLSRPPRRQREPANRYEWPCPGDLLHMDTSRYARFLRPGHRVTGDRSQHSRKWGRVGTRVGYDFVHAIVDDHSRLAYAEIHPDEKAPTVTGFLERALAFFAEHGITARRLMTDNAFAYARNRSLRELLAERQIRHLRTEPYRPRTNGKVERLHQTMAREWAYGLSYRSHHHRNQALPEWLDHYNQTRPHSSLGGRAPISRVHKLCGQDN